MTTQPVPEPKQQAILHAAWQAFAAYGYRKTSMDDIARGAAISRPALYLHYRNKEDIFRSLTQYFYDQALDRFEAELQKPGKVGDVLASAFLAKTQDYTEALLNSQHGRELMDANHAISTDIVAAGEARVIAAVTGWLTGLEAEGQIRLAAPAEQVARLCETMILGLIQSCDQTDRFAGDVTAFCHLIGRGLEQA